MSPIYSQSLYKYTQISDTTLQNLSENQLYFSSPKDFNDPYEFIFEFLVEDECYEEFLELLYEGKQKQFYDMDINEEEVLEHTRNHYFVKLREALGVHCLSAKANDDIMWAHYGDRHKGICIEYNQNLHPFSIFAPVNYVNEIYKVIINDVESFGEKVEKVFEQTLLRKSRQWDYEKEYRFIMPAGTKLNYSNECIKSITFGFFTTQGDKEKIIKATSHLSTQYYDVVRSIKKYKIDRQPFLP